MLIFMAFSGLNCRYKFMHLKEDAMHLNEDVKLREH